MGVIGRQGDRQHPADRLDPMRLAVIVDEGNHGLNRRSSSAWACVDVYGPRPIATAGLIRIDGHNCRRISGFVMRLDNVFAASPDGFSPASTSKPHDIGMPCRSTHQVREATG